LSKPDSLDKPSKSGLTLGSDPLDEVRHHRSAKSDDDSNKAADSGDDDSSDSDSSDSDTTDKKGDTGDDSRDMDGKD
jgi:hypothetical protein